MKSKRIRNDQPCHYLYSSRRVGLRIANIHRGGADRGSQAYQHFSLRTHIHNPHNPDPERPAPRWHLPTIALPDIVQQNL